MGSKKGFRPALLVVDMQEDFCPPDGTLAMAGARELAAPINQLLDYPFILKIATRDFHPVDHVSFETSHAPPNNKAFESRLVLENPYDTSQKKEIPIWPVHCVQGTKGSEIIPEIHSGKFDHIVQKGKDKRLEMFSAFADVFGGKSSEAAEPDLAVLLQSENISHVFVVGVAGDFCVGSTALDARREGFEVFVVDEGVQSVNPGANGWGSTKAEFEKMGVKVISINSPELEAVLQLS